MIVVVGCTSPKVLVGDEVELPYQEEIASEVAAVTAPAFVDPELAFEVDDDSATRLTEVLEADVSSGGEPAIQMIVPV